MRPPVLRISHDELIVDNFAGGGGASLGIEWALGRSPDIAINHNPIAIAIHKANHPRTRHFIEDVWDVDPVEACGGRRVALAWFSPDCTYHSKARGGKPFRDRDRATRVRGLAWIVIRWAERVRPRVIMLENVEEFADWGPLGTDGKPCPLRKGFTFRRWCSRLRNLGYALEMRERAACVDGAGTTRTRLFVIARCDGQPIVWPEETHGPGAAPYVTAAECIDWSIPCPSIFLTAEEGKRLGVRRPLKPNTERRIARGLWKFVIDCPEPFIVPYYGLKGNETRAHSIDAPLRTITGDPTFSLVTPYIAPITHAGDSRAHRVSDPLRTITSAKRGEFALISPVIVGAGGPSYSGKPVTAATPFGTLTTENHRAVVAAFLAKHYGGHETPGSRLRDPVGAVTARDHNALVASHIVKLKGSSRHGQRIDVPLHTVQAGGNHYGEVRAFLMKYHRDGGQLASLAQPMPTVVTSDSIGLVTVLGEHYAIVDIGMRMLRPRELFRAQGFPDSYIIDPLVEREIRGRLVLAPITAEMQTEAVGNSVSPYNVCALVLAQFAQGRDRSRREARL